MRRNQMTWMAAALGAVALSGMVSCGKAKDAGSAAVSVGTAKH
jgi:outer membrane murein-binding lipoprotein Lpp